MTAHPTDNRQGVTWFRPQRRSALRGVTWMFAIVAATASLLATSLTSSETPELTSASVADVGTVSPSMIGLLNNTDIGRTEPLSEVRRLILEHPDALGDGSGIDVAVIDTGVAPVPGLMGDKVLHGPDLSFEGAHPEAAYIDTYGHGTHIAAIVAGNRPGQEGVAPGARVVSLKVAGHDGITTVPQVVAAIDWVVEHRNRDGLNIRVLNLSLGQAGVSSHVGDPLSAAVERAWKAGIFVVVAAGNAGHLQRHLDSPAIDPYVMAVGALDSMSSHRRNRMTIPVWSATGDGVRNPDGVAAGRSIASYRVPGSTIDVLAPSARVGEDLFRGSGSSQAAAVVSGAAAVFFANHPEMDNDDLKNSFRTWSQDLRNHNELKEGQGSINTAKAVYRSKTDVQSHTAAAGPGTGIVEPSGATWSGGTWSGGTWSGATWSGATWSGGTWSGATWSGATWSGATWSGATWSGGTWSGATWSGATWSGATWSGATWSGNAWVE